jgi:hypothetical protein
MCAEQFSILSPGEKCESDAGGMAKLPIQVTGRQYQQCPHCKAVLRNTRAHSHIRRRCPVLHPKPPQPPKRKKVKKPRAQRNHPPIIPDPRERKVVAVVRLKPKSRLIRTPPLTAADLQERPPGRRRKGAHQGAWHSPLEAERESSNETFRRCRFCRKPAMSGSDLCYTCESD